MSEKLDFSGFSAEPVAQPPPKDPPVRRTSSKTRKPATGKVMRRKRRVNVSLDPAISRGAVAAAEHRGMTLSDFLRAAYRELYDRVDSTWFDSSPAPFAHQSAASSGRIVHMLYLTEDEVRILDELATLHSSSRSGVVAAFLGR